MNNIEMILLVVAGFVWGKYCKESKRSLFFTLIPLVICSTCFYWLRGMLGYYE